MNLLPPNSSALERAFDTLELDTLGGLAVPVGDVWSPVRCPAPLLPWLGWGLSIDIWDSSWSDPQKRDAIAGAIEDQRRKGTRAAVRRAVDRIDPLIGITEWFEEPFNLVPHTFRLNLPDLNTSTVTYDDERVGVLLRDIAAVKPLRSHVFASYRIHALAQVGVVSAVVWGALSRFDMDADVRTATEPEWPTYLQTEDGEPILNETGRFLVA